MTTPEAAALRHHEPMIRNSDREEFDSIECECGDQRGAETFTDHLVRVLTPLAPEVVLPRRDGLRVDERPTWTEAAEVAVGLAEAVGNGSVELLTPIARHLLALAAARPPDSGEPRVVDDEPCATCGVWRRFHGSQMGGLSGTHQWRAEPRDAGIDAALLRAAIIEVLDPNDPPATNINVLLDNTAELVREYARLRSGSPAPEGGE